MSPKKLLFKVIADFLKCLVYFSVFFLFSANIHAQICLTQDANPSAPVRLLYIIAGQSNAVGLASVKDINAGKHNYAQSNTVYPNVKIYGIYGAPLGVAGNDSAVLSLGVSWSDFARWKVASPGFGYKNLADSPHLFPFGTKSTDLFGPELHLAHFLNNRPPYDHYIAKLAVSNTSLNYTSSADNWMPTGHLYNELLKLIANAYNSKRAHVQLRVAGIFFMQGETDALNEEWAKNYKTNLRSFVQSIRRDVVDMGCSSGLDFPVVVGRIQDNPVWIHRKHVRSAQQDVGGGAPQMDTVDTDDFAQHLVAGGVHFNEYAQYHLGARAYRAFVTASAAGNVQGLVRRKAIPQQQGPIPRVGALWKICCCGAGALSNRLLQKYLPWTYRYDGIYQGHMCTSVY